MKELIFKHKGAFVGGLIGLIVAMLILTIGFWKTLLILLMLAVGVVIGMLLDGNSAIKNSIDRFKKK